MQEFLVSLILLAAVWILYKQIAPRTFRLYFNRTAIQIATILGWKSVTQRLAEKRRHMTGESGCTICAGCSPRQQAGCEIRIRPEDIRKE